MSTPNAPRVTEARLAARAEAARAGIDAAFIAELVETFYERIRAHPRLGPIFESRVGESWQPHLETMKTFWGSLAFHDGKYAGRPMPAHMKLKEVVPDDFQLWLELFDRTLGEIGASDEAHRWFLERADRIARSFQLQMFFAPQ